MNRKLMVLTKFKMMMETDTKKKSLFKGAIKNPFPWIAFLFLLYSLIGFVIVPVIVKSQILRYIKDEYKREASIESVSFNPYTFIFSIEDFKLLDKDKSVFLSWKEFFVNLNVLPLLGKKIDLDEVRLTSPGIVVKKISETEFNFSDLIMQKPVKQIKQTPIKKSEIGRNEGGAGAKTPKKEDKEDLWEFFVGRLEINSANLTFEDLTLDTLFKISITPANLTINKLHPLSSDSSKFNLNFGVSDGGKGTVQGVFTLEPIAAEAKIKIDKINFKQSKAYLEQFAYLRLDNGKLSTEGTIKVRMQEKNEIPDIIFVGSGSIDDFSLYDTKEDERFLEWSTLKTNGVSVKTNPVNIIIGEVKMNKLYSRVAIAEDQTINLLKVLKTVEVDTVSGRVRVKPQNITSENNSENITKENNSKNITKDNNSKDTTNEKNSKNITKEINSNGTALYSQRKKKIIVKSESPQKIDTSKFNFDLGKVTIENSEMFFSDFSLPLRFAARIHDFNGEIVGISYGNPLGAAIDLQGTVDEYGLARIKGNMDLFNPMGYSDIKTNFNNIELTSLSPYSAKFMGYMIESGKLSLDVQYVLEKGILNSYSKIYLHRMELGDEVEGEEGFGIPVKLALALLKDGDGNVDLDFEVQGDLNDPKVNTGTLVWWAVKRVLLTIVSAPFRFLGNLLGISGDDLEYVDFDPGESKLLPNQIEKMNNLNEALNKRPNITLEITGTVDTVTDKEAIRTRKFRDEFTKRMTAAASDTLIDPMKVDVSISKAILDAMFTEKFGASELDTLQKKYSSGDMKDSSTAEKFDLKNYLKELIKDLENEQPVTNEEIMVLASERAEAIRSYMLTVHQVKPERLVIEEEPEIFEQEDRNWVKCQLGIGSL